jgi:integrase/recombinase XerC
MSGNLVPGASALTLVSGVRLLHPDVQVFEAMLDGWVRQQASRNLAARTVQASAGAVRRFQAYSGEFPWRWSPAHLEEWTADLRGVHGLARSTIRSYQLQVRSVFALRVRPRLRMGRGMRGPARDASGADLP